MANLMYAEMGLNFAQGLSSFLIGGEQAKAARAMQRYQETLSALSAAASKNAVTLNEVEARDAAVNARIQIGTEAMQDVADFDVEAAALGVIGNSVEAGRRARDADAARARADVSSQLDSQLSQYSRQRKQIELDQIYGRDTSVIRNPSIGGLLLGTAASMTDTWERHNPTDRRISTRLARSM